jgi:hypothetical protein
VIRAFSDSKMPYKVTVTPLKSKKHRPFLVSHKSEMTIFSLLSFYLLATGAVAEKSSLPNLRRVGAPAPQIECTPYLMLGAGDKDGAGEVDKCTLYCYYLNVFLNSRNTTHISYIY